MSIPSAAPVSTGPSSSILVGKVAASQTGGTQQIAANFNQFLTLLTTQLKNQNPLSPMDTNQFTQQLVQFAGVEQQLKSNDRLDAIANGVDRSASAELTGYIGKSITTDGVSSELGSSGATWSLAASRATRNAIITITDSKDNVVCVQDQHLSAGVQTFSWDGRTSSGTKAPPGLYKLKVDATDASGQKVAVDTAVSGRVDGVDLSGSAPAFLIGKNRVAVSTVKRISAS